VTHQRSHAGGRRPTERDPDGVAQVAADHCVDAWWHRGREQHRLALRGRLFEDLLDVLRESHIEHLVRLVQNHHFQAVQTERPAPDVVECSPWRGDDDIHTPAQLTQLPADGLTAVDGKHTGAHHAAIAVDRFRNLHGEFARRHQHQRHRLRISALPGHPVEQRKSEGGSLPRSSRGLPEQVPSPQ
jgi:hypothetical protein